MLNFILFCCQKAYVELKKLQKTNNVTRIMKKLTLIEMKKVTCESCHEPFFFFFFEYRKSPNFFFLRIRNLLFVRMKGTLLLLAIKYREIIIIKVESYILCGKR